ncbi:MAG TPA: aminopeptidase [Longimicrobiales bacterium]|nr:aminopeptidase [Longimicrobiales bacterium]
MGAHGRRAGLTRVPPAAAAALLCATAVSACSPVYVLKAGWAEAKILSAREPIPAVAADSATDAELRGKLALVLEARRFAADTLGLRVGDSYTTYTRLERDTLALVLSAAHKDRLEARTWWFPIVGRVPYRAYFSESDARAAEAELRGEGFDTYLRPTAAFSTLGWFSDPLLSTVVGQDHVGLVETVLHEIAHTHLFVPGRVQFNESYATFVGHAASAAFFCRRRGGGPDTVWCRRARDRWADVQDFSRFLDRVVADLTAVYGDPGLTREEKLVRREEIFDGAKRRFRAELRPVLRAYGFGYFLRTPLNNATLLARMRYYHRLPEFGTLLASQDGDLAATIAFLADHAGEAEDPFDLLDGSDPGG